MTNSTEPIGYLQQLRFYFRKPADLELYIGWMGAARAGYLLLRRNSGTCFITEAVDERFRRVGIASRLIEFAKGICADLTAEILVDNGPSIKLHQAAGFQLSRDDGRIATYRFKRG